MKIMRECSQQEVLDHWRKSYGYKTIFFRCDILERVQNDLEWFEVEIEEEDIEKIFIISSDDWGPSDARITTKFRVVEVAENLIKGIRDTRIMPKIIEYRKKFEEEIDSIDKKFILISSRLEGNFTILDGNKRSVALQSIDQLIGTIIYLGVSESVNNCVCARYARSS
ncbi:MAG: hypothetical protein NWE88_01930 [Candidatus Bathyarchaeota archaeon]|nr:hypothetical protein [Candidatus Bathyarchaeota archaeon]